MSAFTEQEGHSSVNQTESALDDDNKDKQHKAGTDVLNNSQSSPKFENEHRERPVLVKIEGTLLKLKHKPSTFSSWKKRYFRVYPEDETLRYFNTEKEASAENAKPLKVFEVGHILKVHSVDNYTFQIIFRGSSETVVILRASSSEEKMRWVHHLHLFVRELTAYANWLCLSNLTAEPQVKECSGYLSKLKRTPTNFSTSWNKRFFRINTADKTLEYYNKEPKDYSSIASDRRVINLDQVVEVRVLDPWTFQLEVHDRPSSPKSTDTKDSTDSAKRVASVQLSSGSKSFFCLQAKTPNEQNEWRAIIENYVAELAKFKNIETLKERAMDHRRSVTFNAMEMELERVMNATGT